MNFNDSMIKPQKTVRIPDGVTKIEDNTGRGNSIVEKVIFPGSITDIRNNVFNGCDNLKEVVFKHNYAQDQQYNGSDILQNCPNLKKVCFADFETFDAYSFDAGGPLENGSELYIGGKQVRRFLIPSNTKTGRHNFVRNMIGAKGIEDILFKDGNEVIGYSLKNNNDQKARIEHGLTKKGFEKTVFSKHPVASRVLNVLYFTNASDLLQNREFCRDCVTVIDLYDEFEDRVIKSMNPCTDVEIVPFSGGVKAILPDGTVKIATATDFNAENLNKRYTFEYEANYGRAKRIMMYREYANLAEDEKITEDNIDDWALKKTACFSSREVEKITAEILGKRYSDYELL